MSDGAPKTRVMKKTPLAGGFFLVAPIVIGFAAGLATGDAMRGVIIGTAIGIAFAVALWLVDRRRA
jgi:mannose/fructose/N-acetylgalactosamine-specific phosphotransferase system component IIC